MTATDFLFPLSNREFEALETGKTIKRHFHNCNKILLVVCWNKNKCKLNRHRDQKDPVSYLRRNISVVDIPFTNRDLKKIAKGGILTVYYYPFEITVALKGSDIKSL